MARSSIMAPVGVALGSVMIAACGATAERFSVAAEDFIEGEEVATWGKQAQFINAICTEPASTDVNATFQCTADGSDTHSYVFQVVIVGERKFRIESLQPQD